jgi:hypothetical protein
MPIRINLLAEAQALEDLRRRDPVKRGIRLAVLLVVVVLGFSGYLQTKVMKIKSEVKNLAAEEQKGTNAFNHVILNKKKWEEANEKLGRLLQLRTNRFLNGTLLDALQHTTVDDVQLTRVKILHEYVTVEETKKKDAEGKVIGIAKPASATEKVVLTLEARDNSGGEQTIRYRDAIATNAYFQSMLSKTNEVRLTSSQQQTGADGKNTVVFTLECRFPEKIR